MSRDGAPTTSAAPMSLAAPVSLDASSSRIDGWLRDIWLLSSHSDGDSSHYPDAVARVVDEKIIWFTGDDACWRAAGLNPLGTDQSAHALADALIALPPEAQAVAVAAIERLVFSKQSEMRGGVLSPDFVRARLHAAGHAPRWIPLVSDASSSWSIKPSATELALLERWCARGQSTQGAAGMMRGDGEILRMRARRQDESLLQVLVFDRVFPLGCIIVGTRSLTWTGKPGPTRTCAIDDDVRTVLPRGIRLHDEDIGTIESIRAALRTPWFAEIAAPSPTRARIIGEVEHYHDVSARGVLPAEHAGFLLDDELICFTGGWRAWKALFRTDTKWLDTRASTLAALLAWLPEDEQIAAVKRIKQASGFRLDARSFPRALVRQRVLASASGERIPLEDSASWGIDLRPRADELRALHRWIG